MPFSEILNNMKKTVHDKINRNSFKTTPKSAMETTKIIGNIYKLLIQYQI